MKIYCFVNSGAGTDWQTVLAICEDGHCLASHVSSHEIWAQHDIGITSDWKHDIYKAHCPDGYELEWVPDPHRGKCPGLDVAYDRNQELGRAAKAKKEFAALDAGAKEVT